jgi:riboflavin kinase/FMN adenylyltransferase
MLTFRDVRQAQGLGPTYLTIGNFDGVHRGHQALIDRARTLAAAHPSGRGRAALLVFDPHPLAVLRPEKPYALLTSPNERLMLAAGHGSEIGVIHPFNPDTAQMEARTFVDLLCHHLGIVGLVVGPDFALGRNRSGDIPSLRHMGEDLGFSVHVMEPVEWRGRIVRSSVIRSLLQEGDVGEAADLLGRFYSVTGEVQQGDQRGRTIGIPTANLHPPSNKLLPADGVYATLAHHCTANRAYTFASVTNIGVRPTVDGMHHRIEAHLLDFPPPELVDDLYGEILTLEFVERLRGERRFAGLDALVAQIHADIAHARSLFAGRLVG